MLHFLLALFAPPVAVAVNCRAWGCTAPISVFWITGIVGIAYGLVGGPTVGTQINLYVVILGLILWAISSVWAILTIVGNQRAKMGQEVDGSGPAHHHPDVDESDPMDQVRKGTPR